MNDQITGEGYNSQEERLEPADEEHFYLHVRFVPVLRIQLFSRNHPIEDRSPESGGELTKDPRKIFERRCRSLGDSTYRDRDIFHSSGGSSKREGSSIGTPRQIVSEDSLGGNHRRIRLGDKDGDQIPPSVHQ